MLLLATALIGCGGARERPRSSGNTSEEIPEAAPLRTFTSETTQTRLLLRSDSTFLLQITPRYSSMDSSFSGEFEVAKERYRLFFPDTIARFNELITPVHGDASVVVYPDYSVVLDKKLRQLYVRNTLLTADSATYP